MKGMKEVYYFYNGYFNPYFTNIVPVQQMAPLYHTYPLIEHERRISGKDFGGRPYVVNIEKAAKQNKTFRTAIWTGEHLQVTLMSIPVRGEIGLEIHPHVDQFLRIEEGQGLVQMGKSRNRLDFEKRVNDNDAIMVPSGTWHNVKNIGQKPLKLYSIYAPPQHPFGTVHRTREEAIAAENGGRFSYIG